jgi:hypothetical protein
MIMILLPNGRGPLSQHFSFGMDPIVFVHDKLSQPRVTLKSNARVYQSEAPFRCSALAYTKQTLG